MRVDKVGPRLLRFPLYNKGTAFTLEERRAFGIEGLLPAQHNDIDTQVDRIYKSIFFNPDDVGRMPVRRERRTQHGQFVVVLLVRDLGRFGRLAEHA